MSGFLYGSCGIQSLLKAEELSSPKAISYKLKEMHLKTPFFFLKAVEISLGWGNVAFFIERFLQHL